MAAQAIRKPSIRSKGGLMPETSLKPWLEALADEEVDEELRDVCLRIQTLAKALRERQCERFLLLTARGLLKP